MGFISNLRDRWKATPTIEKFKLVITGICDIGADLLAGMALSKLVPSDEKNWKKAAIITTAGGLGMWAGDIAAKQLNGVVDVLYSAVSGEQQVEEEDE